jgi:hypothetical protein
MQRRLGGLTHRSAKNQEPGQAADGREWWA